MFRGKRILVTGCYGFVGRHLLQAIEKTDAAVSAIDFQMGCDLSIWEQAKNIERFDIVFHLAARTYVPDSHKYPLDFYSNNILSTLHLLELCRLYNAKIIFPSSFIYGNPQYLPIDEQHPINGFNPYSQSKIVCEKICEGYNRDHGVPVIILRVSNTYGRGQNANFLIPKIIEQAKSGKIQLRDARPKRDFLFIDDLTRAYIKSALYDRTNFEIFNIGSGISYSVKEIVAIIIKHFPPGTDVLFSASDRKNEVMDSVYNIDKAKKILDWHPITTIEEGIKKTLK